MSKHGLYLEDLSVGQSENFTRVVTEQEIAKFAEVSGDHNPVHLDEEFAKTTIFKKRIAHGMLGASYISTILGAKMPGPGTIYLMQNLKFKAPVYIGDEVTAKVEITAIDQEKRRVTLRTTAQVGDNLVIDGEALIMVDRKP